MSSLVVDERNEGRDDKGHAFGLAQGTDGRQLICSSDGHVGNENLV
jgi:hypothetical protein